MFAGRLAIPKQAHGPSQRLLDQPHTHTNTSSYSTLPDLTSTMFATQAVHSGMPTGKKYMGWWGAMGGPQQKGITSYSLSPNEQQPMKGALQGYIFNGYKRIMKFAPKFIVPLVFGYGLIAWAKDRNHYLNSKAGRMQYGEEE